MGRSSRFADSWESSERSAVPAVLGNFCSGCPGYHLPPAFPPLLGPRPGGEISVQEAQAVGARDRGVVEETGVQTGQFLGTLLIARLHARPDADEIDQDRFSVAGKDDVGGLEI